MVHWLYIAVFVAYVLVIAIQLASGAADGWIARIFHGRRRRRHARARHSPDPVQAALDEHVAVLAPRAGLAVALVAPDGTRHWFAGHIDGASGRAPDADTLFEIGSISKTFTASLLVAMEQARLVRLDTPLDELLPPPDRPGRQEPVPITLESLATHCSGLPRLPWGWPTLLAMYAWPRQPYRFGSRARLRRWLRGRRLGRGQRYRYSNLGYGVLGNVLADRAGTTYAKALQRFVLQPLALEHTHVGAGNERANRVAQPHTALGRRVNAWDLRAMAPAGGIRSSLGDMARWLEANLAMRAPLDARLHEARANSAGLHRSVALGWHVDGEGERRVVWHNGATGGSRSIIAFAPAHGTGIVVLANSAVSVDALGLKLLREADSRDRADAPLPRHLQHADNAAV